MRQWAVTHIAVIVFGTKGRFNSIISLIIRCEGDCRWLMFFG